MPARPSREPTASTTRWAAATATSAASFGVGPLTVDDSTVLEEYHPDRKMVLRARARPTGVARVILELVAGAGGGTEIHMEEYPISGFAKKVDNPVLEAMVVARNRRSLRRLGDLAARAGSPA